MRQRGRIFRMRIVLLMLVNHDDDAVVCDCSYSSNNGVDGSSSRIIRILIVISMRSVYVLVIVCNINC